jgi:hypothetical protein
MNNNFLPKPLYSVSNRECVLIQMILIMKFQNTKMIYRMPIIPDEI